MSCTFFVAFEKGAEVNQDYYINKHLPMVLGFWKDMGMRSWKVQTAVSDMSPYELIVSYEWESVESFVKMRDTVPAEHQKQMRDDFVNFTKKEPLMWATNVKAHS
jgi:hypothetical protein